MTESKEYCNELTGGLRLFDRIREHRNTVDDMVQKHQNL